MKKLLIVINTLGRAGAETALMEMLRRIDPQTYKIYIYVLLGQGEMVHDLPPHVTLLNKQYDDSSVFTVEGKKSLQKKILGQLFKRGAVFKRFPYLVKHTCIMLSKGKLLPDKLLWRVLSDGARRFDMEFDLAVAYLEGGSTYYLTDYVKAKKKAAFIHVDYEKAGYTRALDKSCYLSIDKVYTVSDEVKKSFVNVYPECADKTEVFHNLLNREGILKKAELPGGFTDNFEGKRILTVGRLTTQKAFEVSIEAMKLLKEKDEHVRWYVLGEGDQRKKLEELIEKWNLKEDFLLPGAVSNPYPYIKQADVYVHASRFEGKSIAIQEAQILGKPILVSDCNGNREQVIPDVDGMMCELEPEKLCDAIIELLHDREKAERLGKAAAQKNAEEDAQLDSLLSMV